jgi:hypothetical protein
VKSKKNNKVNPENLTEIFKFEIVLERGYTPGYTTIDDNIRKPCVVMTSQTGVIYTPKKKGRESYHETDRTEINLVMGAVDLKSRRH